MFSYVDFPKTLIIPNTKKINIFQEKLNLFLKIYFQRFDGGKFRKSKIAEISNKKYGYSLPATSTQPLRNTFIEITVNII